MASRLHAAQIGAESCLIRARSSGRRAMTAARAQPGTRPAGARLHRVIRMCYTDDMARWNVGSKNGMWRGGRSVASNGYVLIRVGKKHHLADVRGYAYEHRLIAEQKLGRRLRPGEIVHHKDGCKSNNAPANIEILGSIHHHNREHAGNLTQRAPGQKNPRVACACGCGHSFDRFDRSGRPRRFVSGHNGRK